MPRANEQAWRGVPATRDFERMLGGLLVVGVTTTLTGVVVTNRALSLAALATAGVVALIAIATLRAIATLAPPSLGPLAGRRRRSLRVAVIGTGAAALDLQAELRAGAVHQVVVAGAIDPTPWLARTREPATLGQLADVGRIVDAHAIDLLLVDAPERRAQAIETVMRACEGDAVRLCDLAAFYEAVFGRLPVSHVDSAWFQWVLHPRFHERFTQRAFDLLVGGALAAIVLPLLGPLALLVRLDGGPALFRQVRIGRDGRCFAIYKLRTMRCDDDDTSERWAGRCDARVTSVGRFLRRTHLDEMPQLLNVLRGEMTLVGPRPEQPQISAGLEETLPLWRGRYRYKPGLTGWAQVRCGYAGSEDGSAWKLAHDLYYLRHQSLALDTAILAQTAYSLFQPQFREIAASPFVTRHRHGPEPSLEPSADGAVPMPSSAA